MYFGLTLPQYGHQDPPTAEELPPSCPNHKELGETSHRRDTENGLLLPGICSLAVEVKRSLENCQMKQRAINVLTAGWRCEP